MAALLLAAGISLDVALAARNSGGFTSPYAAGQILLLVAAGLLFPLQWQELAVLAPVVWLLDLTVTGTIGSPDLYDWTVHLFLLGSATFIAIATVIRSSRLRHREFIAQMKLRYEQLRSERLLLNILPKPVAERLKRGESPIADAYDEVTILFADLVGFTPLANSLSPVRLLSLLDGLFSAFDELTDRYELEKIKTIGDAYMVVSGLPARRADHAEAAASLALAMMALVRNFQESENLPLKLRIGIHCGPVVAGVIGTRKFSFDVWGDTVNVASRLESHGEPDRIQISEAVRLRLGSEYIVERRGVIDLKGKGPTDVWWLCGVRTEASDP
ncbi:MAG: adenylate/guanylate cyclase domain-containing protein, partial [Candidatus Dadabacteria bacterium]